jgi:hypothetical protein
MGVVTGVSLEGKITGWGCSGTSTKGAVRYILQQILLAQLNQSGTRPDVHKTENKRAHNFLMEKPYLGSDGT